MKKTANEKQAPKKTQATTAKQAPKKTQTTNTKQPAKQTQTTNAKKPAAPKKAAEVKPEKLTIAQRKVAVKTGFHITPWLTCAALAALAYFLKFMVPGYSFSALVCCGILAMVAFFEITRLLLNRYPLEMRRLRRFVSACLVIGLLIAGITEGFIIEASFGDPKEQVSYMVVLGAKVREDGPSVSLWDRIYAAADYLQEHSDTVAIVSGGQGSDEPMTEALAMYNELVDLGIDPSRIWLEEKATSTRENLTFTLDLIEEKTGERPEKLGILSSEYHLFRAGMLADQAGVEAVGIPAPTSRLSQRINHFMREIAGVWHYLILGGQYD